MIIGHWNFDARNNVGRDCSGFDHHGTPVAITSSRSVKSGPGRSASFDGATSSLTVDQSLTLNPGTHPFSMEFWFEGRLQGAIAELAGAWSIWFNAGMVYASVEDSNGALASGPISETLNHNKRTHIVVVFDRSIGEVRAIVNGQYSGGLRLPSLGKVVSSGPLVFGQGPAGALLGQLDNVIYYRGALEVTAARKNNSKGRNYKYVTNIRRDSLPMLGLEFFVEDDEPVTDTAMLGYIEDLVYDPGSLTKSDSILWSGEGYSALISSPMSISVPNTFSCEVTFTSGSVDNGKLLMLSFSNGHTLTVTAEGDTLTAVDSSAGATTPGVTLLPLGSQPVPIDYIDGGYPETTDFTDPIDGGTVDDPGDTWDAGGASDEQTALFWGHVVVVMRSSTVEIYVNGVSHSFYTGSRRVVDGVSLAPDYDGQVQDLSLYDSELDDSTVNFHYQTSSTGRYVLFASDNSSSATITEGGFRPYNHRWSVRNG